MSNLNITIDQGATFKRTLELKSSTSGPVIDLTGYTLRGHMRLGYEYATYQAFTLALTNPPGTDGKISCSLSAAETAALRVADYVYDIEIVSAGGDVTRILEGKATVRPEVTK